MKIKEASVVFSTRGQVVIPRRIRKDLGIEEGTRAVVESSGDGVIILRPVTAAAVRRGYGIFKRKAGDKPMSEWWAEYKKEEIAREEAKCERHIRPR